MTNFLLSSANSLCLANLGLKAAIGYEDMILLIRQVMNTDPEMVRFHSVSKSLIVMWKNSNLAAICELIESCSKIKASTYETTQI